MKKIQQHSPQIVTLLLLLLICHYNNINHTAYIHKRQLMEKCTDIPPSTSMGIVYKKETRNQKMYIS